MRTVGTAPGTATFYLPTSTVADMRGGLGLINPGDSWMIDRKWGNPGTATIQQRPDGSWGLRGFGEAIVAMENFPSGMKPGPWVCRFNPRAAEQGLPPWTCSKKTFFEEPKNWIAMGAVAAGIVAGIFIGRVTKRKR